MTTRLEPGQAAPDFELATANDGTVRLSDYRGSKVIVYFYPAASTPGCTKEACDFRDSLASLQAAGYAVVGISPDPVPKLTRFAASEGLTFPLASDPDKSVLRSYGAFGPKTLYGKTVEGVIRSTFVIGEDGMIESAHYGVRATGHVERLRKTLGLG